MRRLLIRDSQSAPLLLRPALSSLLIFGSPSITSDGSIRITIDYDRCIRIMTELRPELDFFLSLFPSVLCASALDQSKRLFLSLSLSPFPLIFICETPHRLLPVLSLFSFLQSHLFYRCRTVRSTSRDR